MFLLEIYSVLDSIRYFDGTVNTGEWSGTVTATATNDGVHLTTSQQNTFLLKNSSQLFVPTSEDFTIEFEGVINNVCTFYISTVNNSRGTTVGTLNPLSPVRTAHYKFEWANGVMKFYINDDLIKTTNLDLSSVTYCGICFTDWQGDLNIYLKDFKVYPI